MTTRRWVKFDTPPCFLVMKKCYGAVSGLRRSATNVQNLACIIQLCLFTLLTDNTANLLQTQSKFTLQTSVNHYLVAVKHHLDIKYLVELFHYITRVFRAVSDKMDMSLESRLVIGNYTDIIPPANLEKNIK